MPLALWKRGLIPDIVYDLSMFICMNKFFVLKKKKFFKQSLEYFSIYKIVKYLNGKQINHVSYLKRG